MNNSASQLPEPSAKRRSLLKWLIIIGLVAGLAYEGWSAVAAARLTAKRASSSCRLKQLGLAMQNYLDTFHYFPPAVVTDADGEPMHSWRIVLLPYFEDIDSKALAARYHWDEPWNGPHNRELMQSAPKVYQCPTNETDPGVANFLAVTGPDTIWPGATPVKLREIQDTTSKTILLVEVSDSNINWLEPRDLEFSKVSQSIRQVQPGPLPYGDRIPVLMADGSTHGYQTNVDPKLWRAMLTRDGGEAVTLPDAE